MADDRFTALVIFILIVQVSFGIINLTGIYTVSKEYDAFSLDKIEQQKASFEEQASKQLSIVDYTVNMLSLVWLGFTVIVNFAITMFTCIPTLLSLFWVPSGIANLIGFVVDAIVIYGVGNRIFDRGA